MWMTEGWKSPAPPNASTANAGRISAPALRLPPETLTAAMSVANTAISPTAISRLLTDGVEPATRASTAAETMARLSVLNTKFVHNSAGGTESFWM